MIPSLRLALLSLLLPAALAAQDASTLLARATARIGATRFDTLPRVRLSYQTLWYRATFGPTPSGLTPLASAEENIDTRDYSIMAWRSERRFNGTEGPAQIVNIVRDSVASTSFGRGAQPQSGAYVTERDELFLSTPSWLLQRAAALRGAQAPRMGRDTTLAGVRHHSVLITLDGRPVTLWIAPDGHFSGLRYVAAQPLDFGLAGFGEMEVKVFYEGWRPTSGVYQPWTVTVFRAGELYKQLVLRRVEWMPALDSATFAIPDSVRQAFLARRFVAMHDLPHDSLDEAASGVFSFAGGQGRMTGAVRLREGWMLIGAGAADDHVARAAAGLQRRGGEVRAAFTFGTSTGGTGGLNWFRQRSVAVFVSAGSEGVARTVLRGQQFAGLTVIRAAGWQRIAGDSVWFAPLTQPDAPGAMLVFVPRLSWAFLAGPPTPWMLRSAFDQLDANGFAAQTFGTIQSVARPAAALRPPT